MSENFTVKINYLYFNKKITILETKDLKRVFNKMEI